MKDFLFRLTAGLFMLALISCKPGPSSSSVKPASPAKVITENDLTTVTLKPEAEQRLGVATVPLATKKVGRTRMLSGELLVPLGRPDHGTNAPGSSGKSIFSLLPTMTPADLVRVGGLQVDADGRIAAARIELNAARVALERAQNLVASRAGTRRAVDEAQTQVQLAEAALGNAEEHRTLLGAPLFDAVRNDVLWVRVSVYAGDVHEVDLRATAIISPMGGGPGGGSRVARPVRVPFSSAVAPATVDLYYEVDNTNALLRAGERVSVSLPMQGEMQSLVVSPASVLYDIHGGTWVYENVAPHTFIRRRVEVRFNTLTDAVLARGPNLGAQIVTTGAAELFGTEFGIGK